MENKSVGIIIINYKNTEEEIKNCISSIKAQTHKNLKVICIGGPYNKAEILNKGLSTIAVTDYVLTIEGQQTLAPTYVERTLDVAQRHEVFVGAVYTNYILDGYKKYISAFDRHKLTNGYDIPNTALIKREAFEKCGFYDDSLTHFENWDMWLRISEKYVLFHLPEHLYSDIDRPIEIEVESAKLMKTKIFEKTLKRVNK